MIGNKRELLLKSILLAFTISLIVALFYVATWKPASATPNTVYEEKTYDLTWLGPVGAVLALVYVVLAAIWVLKKEEGSEDVKRISSYIREGATAYLKRQYTTVAIFFAVMFIILFYLAYFQKGLLSKFVPYAFLTGGFFSGLAGFIGMSIATRANSRTAWASTKSLNSGLRVAFTAGSVMGMAVVGLGLLDLSFWFYFLKWYFANIAKITNQAEIIKTITETMLTFEMGASSMALFARVGGGIYTKAADVGADLVGKVEAGIPEDDPRNPAVIADNVGDNVGDVAGMGADLYESYVGSIVATMALGASAFTHNPIMGVAVPLAMAAVGVIASLIGNFLVRTKEEATQSALLAALRRGIYSSAILVAIASFFVVKYALGMSNIGIWFAILIGLAVGIVIGFSTEYYTSSSYKPTRVLASYALTGHATVIINGLALAMESVWIPITAIVIGTLGAFYSSGGAENIIKGLYGIGVASIGMLSTLGITLSTDAYGPVADNAGGITEMAGLGKEIRKRTDALDALGNTTAATGKGFAIGSAALTALALLAAYKDELLRIGQKISDINLVNFIADLITPATLIGLFIGAGIPFIFAALIIKAVGRAASKMVEEVRRQFREIEGLLEGKPGVKPDYARCVEISTFAAQKEMIAPALLAIVLPLVTGILFGPKAVVGLLAGALVTGFPMAIFMANAGGAWDNAKKYIEEGNYGGKGSDPHKAAVTGDTVGDPLKDSAGPSLNILIKLMSMVSIVFAATTIALNKLIGLLK